MAIVGLSLALASILCLIVRPPAFLAPMLSRWLGLRTPAAGPAPPTRRRDDEAPGAAAAGLAASASPPAAPDPPSPSARPRDDRAAMPPPPLMVQPPTAASPGAIPSPGATPKAEATRPSPDSIPVLSLSDDSSPPSNSRPSGQPAAAAASAASMKPPPAPARVPTLAAFPAANSPQRAGRGPVPDRGASSLSAPTGLAPPPSHSSRPQKPRRQVVLDPGHSPLDWARLSAGNADLRGLGPDTPYLRVPPSLLRRQTGRKGKDAWMAINGKVYNITPYARFHPGGVPELMRGAGRDATKLFGEIHPWVNYDTMLAACLVGLLVDEPTGDSAESEMDAMD